MKAQQLGLNLVRQPTTFRPMKPRMAGSVKDVVSRLYDQVGGVDAVMLQFGIGKSQAYAFTDEKSPEEMSLARALALTTPTSPAVAEAAAARAGCILTPLPSRESTPPMMLTAASMKEHGEAIAEALKALHAGKLTAAHRARVVKELDESIAVQCALRGTFLEEGGQ